ncbi:MAG: N,N-dimethylformamidase beta subunit family domain-containing protein, partial [Thermoactinomyces sp.]
MKRPHTIYFCIFVVGMIVLFTGVFTYTYNNNQIQADPVNDHHPIKVSQHRKESVKVNGKQPSWMISKPAVKALQGYASDISVTPGQTIKLFINSTKAYSANIYRMGYYNGSGAKLMKQLPVHPPVKQTATVNPETMDANWKPVQTLKIPADWPSGFYLIKLTNTDGMGSYIPFVIHEKKPTADFAVLLATNTYEAYNGWGGKSLYTYNSSNHEASHMVSFNRPFDDENGSGQFFKFEYNLVRWLEKNNYNITYITDTDIDEGILDRSHIK